VGEAVLAAGVVLGLLAGVRCASDNPAPAGPSQEAVYGRGPLNYLLFVPASSAARKHGRYPLILSLHGIGERGSDLQLLKRDGLPKILDGNSSFQFMVVSPQCPVSTEWYYDRTDTLVRELLDSLLAWYPVDTGRVYITGYSMGGIGAWDMGIRHPRYFAAAAPIAARREGSWDPCSMVGVPVWAFHGDQDDVVPLYRGQDVVNAFRACGGDATFTVYPGVGHDSWSRTYNSTELYSWMLSKRRAP
jgi:predicted peptidase